jgi:hypothetical protein
MDYPQLMLHKLVAKVTTREVQESRRTALTVQAFYSLACWALSQFAENPLLSSIVLTALYRVENVEQEQLVVVQHHLKVVAYGADLGLSEPGAQEALAHELAPIEFLGQGTITIERSTDLVREFIAALDVNDSELIGAAVHRLATRLVPELGKIDVRHTLSAM